MNFKIIVWLFLKNKKKFQYNFQLNTVHIAVKEKFKYCFYLVIISFFANNAF